MNSLFGQCHDFDQLLFINLYGYIPKEKLSIITVWSELINFAKNSTYVLILASTKTVQLCRFWALNLKSLQLDSLIVIIFGLKRSLADMQAELREDGTVSLCVIVTQILVSELAAWTNFCYP